MIKRQPPTAAASGPRPRRGRVWLAPVAAAVAGLALLVAGLSLRDRDAVTNAAASTSRGAVGQAVVSVDAGASAKPVPRSYFGLSTEYWTLPIYSHHLALLERVLALLHVRGDGPLILRIGGDSADHSFWQPLSRATPSWMFSLTPSWLSQTGTLARQTGLKLIVDLNLITGTPLLAGDWAAAARRGLPRRSIVAFEIGNEDDIYSLPFWRATVARAGSDPQVLPDRFSPAGYSTDFQSYSQALARVAPGVPLAGPALANPRVHADWIAALLSSPHPGLGLVSAHDYPYSACVRRSSPNYPSISRLLSRRASEGVAQSVAAAVRLARGASLPFRLTELNSVGCGGVDGISDSFATALWAPDTLFALLRAGVDGVNIHIRAHTVNAPFALGATGLLPRPLLYGLILFTRALGPHAQLLYARLHERRSLPLSVWAVRVGGDDLRLMLIDKSSRSVRVHLQVPAQGPATVERLLAASAKARSGVTLGGQWLGRNGRWHGSRSEEQITSGKQGYGLTIRGSSAVLVNFDHYLPSV